jgi:soluble lytic murein transglycosylase-like protein
MQISPVDLRRALAGKAPRSAPAEEAGDFGRILDDKFEKVQGETAGTPEKVALAAEILRLEMMRSAVAIGEPISHQPNGTIGDTLKSYLTGNVTASQKTDTPSADMTAPEENPPIKLNFLTPAPRASTSPTSYDSIITSASRRFGVDEGLIKAVIRQESNFNPNAVSRAGAKGLMQLMPGTAAGLGVKDSFNPEQNIMAGTRFLRDMLDRYNGDLDSALAAYNWGPGNVDKNRGAFLPRETREYLVKVKKYYTQYVG